MYPAAAIMKTAVRWMVLGSFWLTACAAEDVPSTGEDGQSHTKAHSTVAWSEGPMTMGEGAISVEFDPSVLSLRDTQGVLRAFIELPWGEDVTEIDVSTIRLNGTVAPIAGSEQIGNHDQDDRKDLSVAFEKSHYHDLFRGTRMPGDFEVEVTGEVREFVFKGSARVRVTE